MRTLVVFAASLKTQERARGQNTLQCAHERIDGAVRPMQDRAAHR